ncbi:EF-hand domain-containing protein [Poseidonibacter antarcticus]|uniref:EF-hand domain-containing protein n=1 Tax=Poseidonibacter antarcticus TaxID=2478538 RepID=UPI000EF44712|nr:EF-hand domain-containing protein [Poseidonibacter antarcticus]
MIDTANMGIMANLIQPTSTSISSQMISKKDSDKDSSLNIEEMGVSDDIFSAYDSDSNGLIGQSELTSAIDSAMSEFSQGMPSKEDFQSMLSAFGFENPSEDEVFSSSQEETISSILADYDADNLSKSDAQAIVSALQDEGIQASSELESAMAEAGFDAQEIGTLAGVGQGGTPPPAGGGQMSSSEVEEEFDTLDTNEDGVVSLDELQEVYGGSTSDETTLSSNQQNALDNLSVLMDMLKTGAENEESAIDTKSFDGLLKAINNQNNNSQINTYLQNTNASTLSGYA